MNISIGGRASNNGQYLGGGPVDLKVAELFKLLEAQGQKSYEKKIDGVTQLVRFLITRLLSMF